MYPAGVAVEGARGTCPSPAAQVVETVQNTSNYSRLHYIRWEHWKYHLECTRTHHFKYKKIKKYPHPTPSPPLASHIRSIVGNPWPRTWMSDTMTRTLWSRTDMQETYILTGLHLLFQPHCKLWRQGHRKWKFIHWQATRVQKTGAQPMTIHPCTSIKQHLRWGRGILTELSLFYSIVPHYNDAQWYEQFLQVAWLDRALMFSSLSSDCLCIFGLYGAVYIY